MRALLVELPPEQLEHLGRQDQIVGAFGAIVILLIAVWVVKRLVLGKPTASSEGEEAVACAKCGYYLVPTDVTCPKCHSSVIPKVEISEKN